MIATASHGPVVLAIRMRQFGDVLATLGALKAIKQRWRDRRIVYVVDEAFIPVLEPVEFIDEFLPSPPRHAGAGAFLKYMRRVRELKPAAVLDFHGNPRSALLTLMSGAPVRVGFDVRVRRHAYTIVEPRVVYGDDGIARPRTSLESALALARHVDADPGSISQPPEILVDAAAIQSAWGRLRASGVPGRRLEEGRVVGLNPGKPYPSKEWDRRRFVAVGRELAGHGRHVVVMWGPGEEDVARDVAEGIGLDATLAPSLTLGELPGVVKSLSSLITIDSGLKHLAVCLRVPTVTLFGSTDPREWHMGDADDRYLWRGLSCSPCRRSTCPFGAPCMDITATEVLEAVKFVEGGWA